MSSRQDQQGTAEPAEHGARRAGGGHVPGLDPLRGAAALAVAFFHFSNNGLLPKDHWMALTGYWGHLGVRTFFVISGFVIPLAMHRGGYSHSAFVPFMRKRMRRIYPPYVASVLVVGLAMWIGSMGSSAPLRVGGMDFAAHFLFLNQALGRPWLLEIYWTLAVEMQYYLFVALAWPLISSRSSLTFGAYAMVCIALRLGLPGEWHLAAHIEYFLPGMLLFRIVSQIGAPRLEWPLLLLSFAFIGWHNGLPALAASLLPVPAIFWVRVVPRPARFLGKISYSLYLFHLPAAFWLCEMARSWNLGGTALSYFMLLPLSCALLGSWLAYRIVEAPSIAWAKRLRYHAE